MKRLFDILMSSITLLIFLPFAIPIVIVLRLTGEGKIFYLQKRMGYGGEPFQLFKFATMLKDSPNLGPGDITVQNDPRVLPAGKFLRKTKLNEVPQILNILKGDMSIVGPRPLTPKNFAYYSEDDQKVVSSMRPGLTGIGSIVFRDEESIISASDKPVDQCYREEIAPYKAKLEQWYHTHRSFITDLLIIFVTAWVVINSKSTIYRKIWKDLPA
ncbi:MAG: sugar transferase [Spirochaetales bacterium]|nr:sugar transferase [Spirochaetales bacterium]